MALSAFFNSYIGMYISQAFCHSVLASIISDQALRAWNVDNPEVRQRFRVIAVLVPVISFPLYQAINPVRSSVEFRLGALFDVNRWLNIEIAGISPVSLFFVALLIVTSLVFAFQEMLPILMHVFQEKGAKQEGGALRETDSSFEAAAKALSIAVPDVVIIEDDEMVIFSTTGKKPSVFVSEGVLNSLASEELQVALAHELAHIARSRRPVLLAVFFLRIIMFFNPVSLVEFRRAVRNEEKICDDIAVSLTHRPDALADALRKFLPVRPSIEVNSEKKSLFTSVPLEEYSHSMQLESRIARLKRDRQLAAGGRWFLFILTIVIIMVLNYFIV